jgi:hypothetical protein
MDIKCFKQEDDLINCQMRDNKKLICTTNTSIIDKINRNNYDLYSCDLDTNVCGHLKNYTGLINYVCPTNVIPRYLTIDKTKLVELGNDLCMIKTYDITNITIGLLYKIIHKDHNNYKLEILKNDILYIEDSKISQFINITQFLSSDGKIIIIENDGQTFIVYPRSEFYYKKIDASSKKDTIIFRNCFNKYILYKYSTLDKPFIINKLVVLTGTASSGFGDLSTLLKAYYILKRKFNNVKIIFPRPQDESVDKVRILTGVEPVIIDNIKKYGDDFYYGDYDEISSRMTIDLTIYTPISSAKIEGDIKSTKIVEYGFAGSDKSKIGYNLSQYSSGLFPTEIGIYTSMSNVEHNNNIFLGYFEQRSAQSRNHSMYIFFIYLVSHFVIDKKIDGDIMMYLPNNFKINNELLNKVCSDGYGFVGEIETVKGIQLITIESFTFKEKTFNIISKKLTMNEFEEVLYKCGDFVGCTGDQSISQVISVNKIPIYDCPAHKLEFVNSIKELAVKMEKKK